MVLALMAASASGKNHAGRELPRGEVHQIAAYKHEHGSEYEQRDVDKDVLASDDIGCCKHDVLFA